MSYGKITKQELSKELLDLIQKSSSGVVFMKEGEEIPVEDREEGVLYILELSETEE